MEAERNHPPSPPRTLAHLDGMTSPTTSDAAAKEDHTMLEQATAATAAAKEKEDAGARAAAREAAADAAAAAATAPPSAPAPVPGGSLQFRSDMLLVGGKPGLFHCNYCMRDISNTIRIKCAETSTCPDWDLCVDCFGAGVELGKHKNDHPYRVVDNTAYPIFAPDWTATEELLMLSALETHGMGNWGKVSEVLNSKDKTEKACMEHYLDLYLHSYGSILPRETLGYGKTFELLTEAQRKEYVIGPLDMETYPEALHLAGAPPPPPHGTPYSREKGGKERREGGEASSGRGDGKEGGQAKEGGAASTPLPTDSVIPGYMPLRGDFDVEHDNEAELILAEMEISPDEDPAEKELKLMVVDVFNRKLDERDRRKEFVKTFNLTDYKALQNKEKRKPKDERELIAKLRVFARYQTPQEHEQFVLGILEAKRLRKRIEQLQQYRRLGIRTQADALAYENEKRKREQEQQMRKQRAEASYLYETAKPTNTTKDRSWRYKKRNRGDSDMEGVVAGLEEAEGGGGGRGGGGGGEGGAKRKGAMVAPGPLNIDEYPGVELLSGKEKELCAALRLLPKHYLYIKNRILQESEAAGLLLPTTNPSSNSNSSSNSEGGKEGGKGGQGRPASSLIVMDVEKKKGVYDFMVRVGWITPRAAAARSDMKEISITVNGGEGGATSSSLPPSSSPPSVRKGRQSGSGKKKKEAGKEEEEMEEDMGEDGMGVDKAASEKEKAREGGGEGGEGGKGVCPPSAASQRKTSRSSPSPSPSPSSPAPSSKRKGLLEEGKGKGEATAMET